MKYRLGIDLGTASIGTAAYELNTDGQVIGLAHLDSYIFGEPVDPKEMLTLNTGRRSARLIRRQVERKAAILKKLGYIAHNLGVLQTDLIKIAPEKIHELRARAIDEKVTLPEFIKILFHLVKNRGYAGDVMQEEAVLEEDYGKKKKKKLGPIAQKLQDTTKMLAAHKVKSLGVLIYQAKKAAEEGKKFPHPWRKLNEGGTFITRDLVKEEFELLWAQQSKHHPQLNGTYAVTYPAMFPDHQDTKSISLKEAFTSALFYQRPIRWDLDSVGRCELDPAEYRAACAQNAYQAYRLAKNISNLRLKNKRTKLERPLVPEEMQGLFHHLLTDLESYDAHGVFPFASIYSFLKIGEDERLTIDYGRTAGLKGNATSLVFYKQGVLNEWSSLPDKAQELVLEFLANITKYSDIEFNPDAYISKSMRDLTKNIRETDEKSLEEATQFILLLKKKRCFQTDLRLEKNRASYGISALKKITERLLNGEEETAVIEDLYPSNPEELRSKLRPLSQVVIGSPVIDRVLREFDRVMTYIIHKLGDTPAEITIELSRDLRKTLAQRQFIEKQNAAQESERKHAAKELTACHYPANGRNIERYLLWQEQDQVCPYSGQKISVSQAFDEKTTQVDHILPQASGGPNIFSNKVLVFTQYNLAKGDQTPWLCYQDGGKNCVNWDALVRVAGSLKQQAASIKKQPVGSKLLTPQRKRNLEEKAENLLTEKSLDEIGTDFSNRQNQQTAWIGKIVLDWCKDICPKVNPTFGGLTAHLRKTWHVDRVLPDIRLSEGKTLYNKEDKPLDSSVWKELYSRDVKLADITATKEDFEEYLKGYPSAVHTQTDREEAWYRFKQNQRPYYTFNKRCDHRHHAIDAAVIGLCTVSLVQSASKHNGRYGTLNTVKDKKGLERIAGFYPECPVQDLPCILQNRLTNYVVWHKPDHFPSGQLFEENAYNVVERDGAKRLIKRYDLSYFLDKKSTLESVIKDLEIMLVGVELKKAVIAQLQTRVTSGMTLEEALLGKDEKDGIIFKGNKVKKVQAMYKKNALISFKDGIDKALDAPAANGKPRHKYYLSNGYACMDFDTKTGARKESIPLWRYQQEYKNKPVPTDTVRIFAEDIIFDKKNQEFYKIKSFLLESGLILTLTTESSGKPRKLSSMDNFILIPNRQKLAEVKKEYGK